MLHFMPLCHIAQCFCTEDGSLLDTRIDLTSLMICVRCRGFWTFMLCDLLPVRQALALINQILASYSTGHSQTSQRECLLMHQGKNRRQTLVTVWLPAHLNQRHQGFRMPILQDCMTTAHSIHLCTLHLLQSCMLRLLSDSLSDRLL